MSFPIVVSSIARAKHGQRSPCLVTFAANTYARTVDTTSSYRNALGHHSPILTCPLRTLGEVIPRSVPPAIGRNSTYSCRRLPRSHTACFFEAPWLAPGFPFFLRIIGFVSCLCRHWSSLQGT